MKRRVLRRLLLRSPRLFVALFTPDDAELGALGEEVAAFHLSSQGWRILARRLRTRSGEADLVVERGSALAVVEVKTGRTSPVPTPAGRKVSPTLAMRWRPGLRCDAKRIVRLEAVGREIAAAGQYRSGAPRPPRTPRVDLVEVFLDERSRRFRVLHHPDLRARLA